MDEQRITKYVDLIEQLLSCPSGEEKKILQQHSTLIDQGLVLVMILVVADIAKAGGANAESLQNLAAFLAEAMEELQRHPLSNKLIRSLAASLAERMKQLQQLNYHFELYQQGKFQEAITFAESVLKLAKSLYQGDHPDVARSLNNLAGLYKDQGRLSEAETLFREALQMRQRLFAGDHPDVAASLNNLAELYQDQGRLSEAETLYLKALEMFLSLFPGDHADVATSLNNLAALYQDQGHLSEAEFLYLQALQMTQRLFVGDHRDLARSLNNLAALYQYQGHLSKAESLCLQALQMLQRLFPGDHADVALSLNNLAVLYQYQGCLSEAESLYLQALQMCQRLFAGDHADVALSLNNLAALYEYQGRLSEAEPLYREALQILERLFAGDHPHVVTSLSNLALLLTITNRPTEALEKMRAALEVEDNLIRRIFAFSCERERLAYLDSIRGNFDLFISLVCNYLSDSSETVQIALDVVLKRKCLTASALAALNYAVYSGNYPQLQAEFNRLRGLRAEVTKQLFNPPLPEINETETDFLARKTAYKNQLYQLEQECENLEKQLSSQVPEIQLQEQPSDRRAVALELPENSALLEFVRFHVFDFKTAEWQPARYVAFVLPYQDADAVRMVQLGDAENIDRLVQNFRETAASFNLQDLGLRPTKKLAKKVATPSYNQTGIKLFQEIFAPLSEEIKEYQHLFIAPDGDLNLVPFQILPQDETGNQLLLDKFTISYLSVGRDILREKIQTLRPAAGDLIIGDPDFDFPNSGDESLPEEVREKELTPKQFLSKLSGDYFTRAPETGILAAKVAEKLEVQPYLQENALECHLTSGKCPRILLIATHGYFQQMKMGHQELIGKLLESTPDKTREILENHRYLLDEDFLQVLERIANQQKDNFWQYLLVQVKEIREQFPLNNRQLDRKLAVNLENPMMRSGIALAGANTWHSGGNLPPEAGDGLFLADDVAQLDLWANEITVLVACETGLGDIKMGEGVFGLRRAFAVAGCKTLIMSLWKVPTKASVLLMQRFFDNLKRGKKRGDALLDAQNYLRTVTLKELQEFETGREVIEELQNLNVLSKVAIKNQLNNQPLKHPYFWGAWVCQGNINGMVMGNG